MSLIQSSQVFTCTDGKQFSDMASAEAHQVMLANAAGIEKVASSFANVAVAPNAKVAGLSGRTRVFNMNVASQVLSFLISQGVVTADDLEAFEAIEPSEELAARLKADAEEAEKKAAQKKAKADAEGAGAGEGAGEGDDKPEVDEDLFGAE